MYRRSVDRCVTAAEARGVAVRRGDAAGHCDAVLHHRMTDRAAAAELRYATGDIILVEIVGVEARVEPGDVDFEFVRRAELDTDIGAVAFAILFEQCRADQGRDQRVAAADGEGAVAEDFEPVAAGAAFLVDRADRKSTRLNSRH